MPHCLKSHVTAHIYLVILGELSYLYPVFLKSGICERLENQHLTFRFEALYIVYLNALSLHEKKSNNYFKV